MPHTGSTGDGYAWAKKAGHTITELFPTEVPILSHEKFIKAKTLQGLSLRDISLSVLNPKGKANHYASNGYDFHTLWHLWSSRSSL